jgi:hypothetical protein
LLVEVLNDRPMLCYLQPTRWCIVHMINRLFVALLLNDAPTAGKRALSAVGWNILKNCPSIDLCQPLHQA